MRIVVHIWLLAALAFAQQWPLHNNGLNEVVQWDHYSLIVNSQRLYMWSGEFHYWRIPVPELWIDILQKIKAAGLNTVSVYAHWGWHSPADGKLDFTTGAHNFSRIFDIAKDLGLYVLFRPGPYINAETNAGGFPGWLSTGDYGSLRNNDTRYTATWTPYWEYMSRLASKHSVTNGGNVILYQIENEYGQQWTNVSARTPNETAIHYMELLEVSAIENGIDIPTLANNPNLGSRSWSLDYDINHVGGDTDVYALDNYPSCWSCNLAECTSVNGFPANFTTFDYFTNFQETAPTQPSILAEFQGGSYNPWGGPQGGCSDTTGPDWVNVIYRNNIGQKVTGVNLYMFFGGTNWGGLPMPTVGTSYDYSAPISESRLIGNKYYETKLLGLFLRAATDLTMIERAGNGTTNFTGNPAVFAQALRNVETGAHFYVVKHANTTLQTSEIFKLNVSTSIGNILVPQYAPDTVINGRQAKIHVTDFTAGNAKLIYSTAEVLTVSIIDEKPLIFLWAPAGEGGEVRLQGARNGIIARSDGETRIGIHPVDDDLVVSFSQASGMSVVTFDNGVRVAVLDRTEAYKTWQPTLSNLPHAPLNETIVVKGPYLVRTASLVGSRLDITGDFDDKTELEVFAPSGNKSHNLWSLTFNAKRLATRQTQYGSLIATLSSANATQNTSISLPILSTWKVKDGLPERLPYYDDSGKGWVLANKTSTLNPRQPDTLPVLYADEYGFQAQNILWRGRFGSSHNITHLFLNVIGGTSSGFSAWLNGHFLGSTFGNTSLTETNVTAPIANFTRIGENVLFVIQDNMGHDQTTGVLNPRGILNATLLPHGSFTSWRVAGKAGGEEDIDPMRGLYNEGGLHAERLGWHLPGFDDLDWEDGSPQTGLSEPGAKFYRTNLPLDLPRGQDISLAFELHAEENAKLRAQLYVNGYMFGKFIPHVGNQVEFPVFPGILDYHGDNTIGLSIWVQDDQPNGVNVSVHVLGAHHSSLELGDTGYLRTRWSADRLAYY